MSDHSDEKPECEIPDSEPEVAEKPEPPKQKRKMSEKQLANLAKAREKAKVKLGEKKVRRDQLRVAEKKLKEMRIKEREDRVQAELNTIKAVNLQGAPEEEPVMYVRKSRKKKKAPKVVYYSSSSSDDSEPELVYKKRPKPKKLPPPPATAPRQAPRYTKPTMQTIRETDNRAAEDAALADRRDAEVRKVRRDFLIKQVFPNHS